LNCVLSAAIAGGIAVALYRLTLAIAANFADKPLPTTNGIALNLAVATRTLVVGVSAMGTGVFGMVALGLVLLAGQLVLQRWRSPAASAAAPNTNTPATDADPET
jgi:hypothetical protein